MRTLFFWGRPLLAGLAWRLPDRFTDRFGGIGALGGRRTLSVRLSLLAVVLDPVVDVALLDLFSGIALRRRGQRQAQQQQEGEAADQSFPSMQA